MGFDLRLVGREAQRLVEVRACPLPCDQARDSGLLGVDATRAAAMGCGTA